MTRSLLASLSILAFVVLLKVGFHPDEVPCTVLDADWIWRRFLPQAWSGVAEGWVIVQSAFKLPAKAEY